MLFVDSHNTVTGVLTFFFSSFFLSKPAALCQSREKRSVIPSMMSVLMQYLSKVVAKITPKEGVSAESHCSHTLSGFMCQGFV